jgi:hypothetical protein
MERTRDGQSSASLGEACPTTSIIPASDSFVASTIAMAVIALFSLA